MGVIDRVKDVLPPKYREMAKFLVVGGTAWCIDTAIFTVLSHTVLAEKVITAKIISILVSTIFSYIANREWSFNHRGGRERHHEAMLFFVVNALALGLNLIPLAVSRYVLGFTTEHHSQFAVTIADFVAANLIGTVIGMMFRYWAYRRFVFPDELEEYDEFDDPDAPTSPVASVTTAPLAPVREPLPPASGS
ncbi:GtrA family protein [Nakamurella leprariae]|uniref:GtrA family protein n=1 Tax=Nakamurella leprariae TaxID=2803911 RepID=UPI002E297AD0|nr:GtrA family protein [Nakamurella leprariae]